MLFYLSESLIVNRTDKKYPYICQAVRNLATAACESKHYVTGGFKVISHFAVLFNTSDDIVAIFFHELKKKYSSVGIPDFINYYIEVVNGNVKTENDDKNKQALQINFDVFVDTKSVQKTTIICEDIVYDYNFYKFILDWFINKKINRNTIPYNFEARHGGGDRTEIVFKSCINEQLTCICIVDTDKKYPEQRIKKNSTCWKCQKVQCGPRNFFYKLNCQELENLLPIKTCTRE